MLAELTWSLWKGSMEPPNLLVFNDSCHVKCVLAVGKILDQTLTSVARAVAKVKQVLAYADNVMEKAPFQPNVQLA